MARMSATSSARRAFAADTTAFYPYTATDGVMANFVLDPTDPLPGGGPVALVSQSGGLGGYMVRKALTAGLNLGWFVSTGNEVDASVSAILRELVEREDVRVLLGAFEALRDPDLFIETALRAQGLEEEADRVHEQFLDAWARSDTYLRKPIF